ncbi:MAG: aminotransferase class I/II-fold pyridoxal phosphate-dependent enzyme [Peptococcaceae bacterium]|jgi:aromatic-amino-acid transaminase|nr:aminotransferase class I/II-fold pyridoxal phosphate-dependent enzyme [Peptococcaceae bacterium]MBQ2020952.1 aminotransferase class I/II-fold pyridoxal phosphate-dependent enzyme [Peptococcaceae bacterium]MBQ2368562.1 aminotransferase class I/II-fold pyridoxal phosphate-dependent enzyme [Peptococcaceae bacterium]MBQ5368669.1 aminotransferase class I/II-fold pyridoxal phosphate-dependent enzyme [Peptococcaceae bacterium]MBQ5658401.1 aminotransferase class I/II-fold pyridoxal phosphate-depende
MSILAKHTVGKGGPDKVFKISGMAKARAAEVGKENIVNATTGAFLDGNGKLMTLKTVEAVAKEIPFYESCEYASIEGSAEFIEASIDAAFREYRPDAIIRGVATAGGTGGIHHAIFNYLEDGDAVLVMNRYWAAYKSICRETNRRLETFPMFTEDWKFNVQGCVDKLYEIAEQQTNVMLIMNTPANNPTGYNVKTDEWEVIMNALNDIANNGKNNVVLVMDIAYIDFAAPEAREMFQMFNNLPANFLVLVAFTMSKSYAMYGYRLGCLLCVTSSEEEAEAFLDINKFSCRATWSNSSRMGMLVMERINQNPELKAAFRAEQEELRLSLLNRANLFIKEAAEVNLTVCPFDSGFFVTIPTLKAEELAAELRKDDIFMIPLGDGANAGLRVALCALPEEKITGMAAKIKAAMDVVGA